MKRLLALVALLAGCGGSATEASPAPPAAPAPAAEAPPLEAAAAVGRRTDVDVARLKAERDAGKVKVLVDVRTPAEFAGGHVPGAINIPLDEVEARASEIPAQPGDLVYVVCEVGGRSSRAADLLAAKGRTTANVQGGTRAWRAAGYPVETPASP